MTTKSGDLREAIEGHRAEILSLLGEMVACNSYSYHARGINEVGRMAAREMPGKFKHSVRSGAPGGDHHVFEHVRPGVPPVVLVGHLDTLCPEDPAFSRMVEKGETLCGPGVNDMKGGDVTLIWALRALDMAGCLDGLSLVCILNGDEEIGSRTSRELFCGMRGKARAGLVFECGAPSGTVVTRRKGIAQYRLEIAGKAAHFGNLRGAKISAVEELARKVLEIEALNAADGSAAVNAGRVEGGLASNAVAERAVLDFEARYWNAEAGRSIDERIRALASRAVVPGCTTKLTQTSLRPPMQPGPEAIHLFEQIEALGRSLGQRIAQEERGGGSDGAWLSDCGIPTVDGLGPLGDHDFTRDEYIVTETLFQRIELAANLLLLIQPPEETRRAR